MNKSSGISGGSPTVSSSRCGKVPKHDIYAYNPSYEWASHKTWFGVACSWLSILFILFYVALTLRDYIVRPPELVSQGDIDLLQVAEEYPFPIPKIGLRLTYNNVSNPEKPSMALANENPYVRFKFQHVVMQNQERVRETDMMLEPCVVSNRPSLCPVTNSSYILQGLFFKENYHFLEITVEKCVGDPSCAPLWEINRKIASGEFRIITQVGIEAQQFDIERFHATGKGFTIQNRSLDYYALPNIELKADIVLQARQIQKEQRYIGSPPMPEARIDVLSYFGRDIDLLPSLGRESNLMKITIRLHESVRQEEVAYWCPSILDLFGLWGAMASFVASLSIGFVAMQYNKWHFYRHFKNATREKRAEATQQALSAMQFVSAYNNTSSSKNMDTPTKKNHRDYMYKNLQIQYDALMVEPDLRLFETHHFDSDGRMAMSAAELKFPTTPFGELRRLAIFEHGTKRRAAQFISLWYGRHLVKKGFITDPERKRQLFSSASYRPPQKPAWYQRDGGESDSDNDPSESTNNGLGGSNRFWSALRQRKRKRRNSTHNSSAEPSTAEDETRLDAMERGVACDTAIGGGPLSPMTVQTDLRTPRAQLKLYENKQDQQQQQQQQQQKQQDQQQEQEPDHFQIPFFHDFIFDDKA